MVTQIVNMLSAVIQSVTILSVVIQSVTMLIVPVPQERADSSTLLKLSKTLQSGAAFTKLQTLTTAVTNTQA